MPGLISNMDVSSPQPESLPDATNLRKSGRAIQKPVYYEPEPIASANANGSAKRKRAEQTTVDVDEISEDSSDGESDESAEEPTKQRRRATKPKNAQKKPAAKKPKTGQEEGLTLAMRPATNGVRKISRAKKSRARTGTSDVEGTGLFGESLSASYSFSLTGISRSLPGREIRR